MPSSDPGIWDTSVNKIKITALVELYCKRGTKYTEASSRGPGHRNYELVTRYERLWFGLVAGVICSSFPPTVSRGGKGSLILPSLRTDLKKGGPGPDPDVLTSVKEEGSG